MAINGSERIARMLVQEGAQVSKGELLAVLETQRLEALVAQAEAQLAGEQAVVDRLLWSKPSSGLLKRHNIMWRVEHEARWQQYAFAGAGTRKIGDRPNYFYYTPYLH